MFKKIGTVYRTLRYLKLSQILYQIKFRLGINIYLRPSIRLKEELAVLKTFSYIKSTNLFETNPYQFQFINQTVTFKGVIDWNYNSNGKLWIYNLNYFEFVTNTECSEEQITKIIDSYFKQYKIIKDGKEPYPTSLRIINLIKIYNQIEKYKKDFFLSSNLLARTQALSNAIFLIL